MDHETALDELLARWLDVREGDTTPDLDAICAGHPELRQELESRIRGVESMERFMGSRTALNSHTGSTPDKPPHIPGYEILGELGRGGMGVVYHARQLNPHREVALKMIRGGGDVRLARFREESESLARIQHPNIVQIFEVGEHEGSPFFSMERLAGGTLKDKLGGKPTKPRQAASWVETFARAVHVAHLAGVIHRDLKPGNVLFDRSESGKIGDFGLAKRSDASVALSVTGDILGTPAYMAPEQARGSTQDIGPAADIYSLGVILYECLTGRVPFLAEASWKVIDRVINEEPLAPKRVNPAVPTDLNTVCLKCLEKDPKKRYASAEALAEDLRRYLDGHAVSARPVGHLGRLWRWSQRKPGLAASWLVAGALLVALLVGVNAYSVRSARQKLRLENAEAIADANARAVRVERFYNSLGRVEGRLRERRAGWRRENFADLEESARSADWPDALRVLRGLAADTAGGIDARPVRTLNSVNSKDPFHAARAAFFPGGDLVALAEFRRHFFARVRLVSAATGEVTRTLHMPPSALQFSQKLKPEGFRSVAVHPSGRWVAAGSRSGSVYIWDLDDDSPLPIAGSRHHGETVQSLAFAPDGSALFSLSTNHILKRWDADRWAECASREHVWSPFGIGVDPLGRWVACSTTVDGVRGLTYLDARSLERLDHGPARPDGGFALHPHGLSALVDKDGYLDSFASDSGERTLRQPAGVAFEGWHLFGYSPCGRYSVRASKEQGRLIFRDAAGGRKWLDIRPEGSFPIEDVAFAPDGGSFVVVFENRSVFYELDGSQEQRLAGFSCSEIRNIELNADGTELFTRGSPVAGVESAHRWDLRSPSIAPVETLTFGLGGVRDVGGVLALCPKTGALLLGRDTHDQPGRVLWRREPGDTPTPFLDGDFMDIRFCRDGSVWCAGTLELSRWPAPRKSRERFAMLEISATANSVRYTAIDGGPDLGLATRSDGKLTLVDPNSLVSKVVPVSGRELTAVAQGGSGNLAAVGSVGGELALVALPGGFLVKVIRDAHADRIVSVDFAGDRFVMSASQDRTVKFWTTAGEPILSLTMPAPVREAEVSDDGSTLAVLLEGEQAVRHWDLGRIRGRLSELGIDPGF